MPHHHHQHHHSPPLTASNDRKMLIAFWLTFSFMLLEAAGGLLSGSLALLADAGHMLTDAGALALAWLAFRLGRRAADSRRTFGYLRLEVVAGLINALSLFAIVGWIGWEAWQRLQSPSAILAGPMLAVAVAGLLVNGVVLWLITRGDTDHVNIRGAALHVLGDLLGSLGAIAAAIIIQFTGWSPIDPLLSLLVSLLILRSAWQLLRQSLHILLEGAPDNLIPQHIEQLLLEQVPELVGVSHIHVWQLTSGHILATLHVRPQHDAQARAAAQASARVLREQLGIEHATIAIDWNDGNATCNLSQGSPLRPHHHSQAGEQP